MSAATLRHVGPYQIDRLLGKGGMGEVYLARDTRLNRTVAIKVVSPELGTEGQRRLEREAHTVASLSHPHICILHDIVVEGGVLCLVMEYLNGDTLANRVKKSKLDVQTAAAIGADIADGLDAAHQHGIIHRDLKPANVMLTAHGAKLLDFGVAVRAETIPTGTDETATLETHTGLLTGTLPYMAPEQLQGKPADTRTDIFSFGAVLYEMLTGRRAFPGDTAPEIAAAILERPPKINETEAGSQRLRYFT